MAMIFICIAYAKMVDAKVAACACQCQQKVAATSSGLPMWAEWAKVIGPILTGFALGFAVFSWWWARWNNKRALVNALFDEIRHNISLTAYFIDGPRSADWKFLNEEIAKLGPNDVYPNPNDNDETLARLYERSFKHGPVFELTDCMKMLTMRNNCIESSLTSGVAINLLPYRIFRNLGHLDFSIRRFNGQVDAFNGWVSGGASLADVNTQFVHLRNEYKRWTHYRLFFMLIELARSVPTRYFYDRVAIDEILNRKGD